MAQHCFFQASIYNKMLINYEVALRVADDFSSPGRYVPASYTLHVFLSLVHPWGRRTQTRAAFNSGQVGEDILNSVRWAQVAEGFTASYNRTAPSEEPRGIRGRFEDASLTPRALVFHLNNITGLISFGIVTTSSVSSKSFSFRVKRRTSREGKVFR